MKKKMLFAAVVCMITMTACGNKQPKTQVENGVQTITPAEISNKDNKAVVSEKPSAAPAKASQPKESLNPLTTQTPTPEVPENVYSDNETADLSVYVGKWVNTKGQYFVIDDYGLWEYYDDNGLSSTGSVRVDENGPFFLEGSDRLSVSFDGDNVEIEWYGSFTRNK